MMPGIQGAAVSEEVDSGFSSLYDVEDSTVSMAGIAVEALLSALQRPAHPGNHQSNQKTKMKKRTRLAYRRSNILQNIIT